MDYLFYPNLGQIDGLFSMCKMKVMWAMNKTPCVRLAMVGYYKGVIVLHYLPA